MLPFRMLNLCVRVKGVWTPTYKNAHNIPYFFRMIPNFQKAREMEAIKCKRLSAKTLKMKSVSKQSRMTSVKLVERAKLILPDILPRVSVQLVAMNHRFGLPLQKDTTASSTVTTRCE